MVNEGRGMQMCIIAHVLSSASSRVVPGEACLLHSHFHFEGKYEEVTLDNVLASDLSNLFHF